MELKLNIYDNATREVAKEFTTNTSFVPLGVVEDVLNQVDMNKIVLGNDNEIVVEALKFVSSGVESLKDILKWTFVGVTDEDLKNTNTVEVVAVIVNILKSTILELSQLTKKSKN